MKNEICRGSYDRLGVYTRGNTTIFSIENKKKKDCFLLLYPNTGEKPKRIPMQQGYLKSHIYSVGIKNFSASAYTYLFEIDGEKILDLYAKKVVGREHWGEIDGERCIRGGFEQGRFSWGEDSLPQIPKEDMIIYKLHVRGFSMQQKMAAHQKGTLKGVERKLSYLQELGITTVEFMPVYEFEEIFEKDIHQKETFPKDKLNYWGYTRGNYFSPKASYLGEGNDSRVLKHLIKKMHERKMECILEFYFTPQEKETFMVEVLRYWALEYHVDGFHVICNANAANYISQDYVLSGCKLFYDWFSEEHCMSENCSMHLYSYNDGFLYALRKSLNHQGGDIWEFLNVMRRQQKRQGFINYLATNNGFTLYDMFSYSEKHNSENGEENLDGIVWNFSSNCGEEGETKKKRVLKQRERLVKNALCCLFLAQGVPLLWMGDEAFNTQKGNNNAYCQDNEIGWKNWDNTRRSKDLYEFVQKLAKIRKEYKILRMPEPMELTDYLQTGFPDLSYHGEMGWEVSNSKNKDVIGMMYNGAYTGKGQDFLYFGCNFSSAMQQLALPALPKDYRWKYILNTGALDMYEQKIIQKGEKTIAVAKQSVCLLKAEKEEKE